jgi:hypothetical protein
MEYSALLKGYESQSNDYNTLVSLSTYHTRKHRKMVASHVYLFTINCQMQAKHNVEGWQDNSSNKLVENCEETTVAYLRYYTNIFSDIQRPESPDSV